MMDKEDLKQIKDIVDIAVNGMESRFDARLGSVQQSLEQNMEANLEKRLGSFQQSIEASFEKHIGNVLEEIMDIRETMATKEDLEKVRLELKTDIDSIKNRVGAVDNRIDEEIAQRKNLESRVRVVLPTLPTAPELV